jgi:hypothetical protein
MTRARAFKKADVTRFAQALQDAGHRVKHIEAVIGDVKIVATLEDDQPHNEPDSESEWRLS